MNRLVKRKAKWLRSILFAGIVTFVALTAFTLGRMDADQLGSKIALDLAWVTQKQIHFRDVDFSFSHGFGLIFYQVTISGPKDWALTAGEVHVVPQLLPLLVGSLRFKSIFILSPHISLAGGFNPEAVDLPPGFGLGRLNIRQGSLSRSGETILDHILLDLRHVAYNDEMLWELKARNGDRKFQSNGRARIDHGSITTAFGKLDAEGLPIRALIQNREFTLFKADHLYMNLTFDLTRDGDWSLSGKAGLQTGAHAPPLGLRGKFDGNLSSGQFSWHDSFIQIGKQTVVETSGQHNGGGGLQVSLRARRARVEDIFTALHRDAPLHGLFDLDCKLSWQDGKLTSYGNAVLHSIVRNGIAIPELEVVYGGLRIDSSGDKGFDWLELRHGTGSGQIRLEPIHLHDGHWSAAARVINVEDWWVGVANTIAALAGRQPLWKGSGTINGEATVGLDAKNLLISARWDAGRAAIGFGSIFDKPINIPASGSLAFGQKQSGRKFILENLLLGTSGISKMEFRGDTGVELFTIAAESIDFSEWQQDGIRLPEALQGLHGHLSGKLKSSRDVLQPDLTGWQGWVNALDGTLQLTGFGGTGFHLDGLIRLKSGDAFSPGLQWKSGERSAKFRGEINLWQASGEVHVWDAVFNADKILVPSWFQQLDMHGTFGLAEMDWQGNSWTDLYGGYYLKSGLLHMRQIKGKLAGGEILSPAVDVDFSRRPVLFQAPLSVTNIHLEQLFPAQDDRLMSGILSARAELQGELQSWHEWQGRGELEIDQGAFIGVDLLNKIHVLTAADQGREGDKTSFLTLHTAFEIGDGGFTFSGLQLRSLSIEATGGGRVQKNHAIDASLEISLPATIGSDGKLPQSAPQIPVHINGIFPEISMAIIKSPAGPGH